jgi:hypothetical protein
MTAALTVGLLVAEGCARQSPAVGTWKGRPVAGGLLGQALGRSNLEATVTLNADGTGFAKLPPAPEQPVTWAEKDGKVTLTVGGAGSAPPNATQNPAAPGSGGTVVGTLAEDGRTMRVDLGPVQLELEKTEAAAGK